MTSAPDQPTTAGTGAVRPADPDAPVLLQVSDQIAHVTLNNPRRKNAMSWAAWAALRDTARALADSSVRVVVITGAGTDFCAGADLSGGPSGRHALDDMRIVGDACLAVHRLPMPVVARVDGVAVGAGLNLALACDLVIASERSRFSEIFVRRGLSVDFGGSWLLPRLVGLHRAKELVLLGDLLDAPTAYEMGLLHRLVPEAELDATVDDLVARLAAGPPIALRLSKRLLNDSFQRNLDEAVDAEATAQAVNHATADTQEAAAAFLERREPRFRGV